MPIGYDPQARATATNAATVANQALVLAQQGLGIIGAQAWTVVNSNTLADDGARLSVDTTEAPVTVTAAVGATSFSLRDNAGTWGTNPVTVVGNGASFAIDGGAIFVADAPGFQLNFTLIDGAWFYTLQFLNGPSS